MEINKKKLLQSFIILTLFGALIFATISALTSTQQIQYTCQISDCEAVRQSQYSQIAGIDLAFFGIAYVLTILLILLYRLFKKEPFINKTSAYLIGFGILFGTYLRYIEIFKLHAWCELCVSFYICLLLAAAFMLYYKKHFQSKK